MPRPLAAQMRLRYKYRLRAAANAAVEIAVVDQATGKSRRALLKNLVVNEWAQAAADLDGKGPQFADEIHILLPVGAQMFVDDLLLYEPGKKTMEDVGK